jgi:hypothetical protein
MTQEVHFVGGEPVVGIGAAKYTLADSTVAAEESRFNHVRFLRSVFAIYSGATKYDH